MKKIFIFSFMFAFLLSGATFVVPQEVSAYNGVCALSAGADDVLVQFNDSDRLFSNRSFDDAHTAFYSVNMPAGEYKITLSSYDNHTDKSDQKQENEQYFVEMFNGSTVVAQSNAITDLPDGNTNMITEVVNNQLTVNSNITKIRGVHDAYPSGANEWNSVHPTCVLFEKINTEVNLVGSCSVNISNPNIGDSVTWKATASGGDGSFSYKWTGTDGLSSSNQNVSKSYATKGTKNASVVITSGTQSLTRNCTVSVEKPQNNELQITCSPDNEDFDIDERVTWQAFVSGGDGDYDYDWSGTDGLDGTSRTESIRYDDDGRKTATVRVTDGEGRSDSATCRIDIEEEKDFDVTCEVSDTRIESGDRVTFDVDIDGGDRPYEIRWSGDYRDIDDFERDEQRQTVRIDDEGRYELEVEVTDDEGRRASDQCRTVVVDDDEDNVTVVTSTNGQVAGVALSQVPYTGLTDNPILNALLYSLAGLTLLVIGSISLFILRKRDMVPAFAGTNVEADAPVATTEYSDEEVVSALEDAAHEKRVIVSSDAMDILTLRSKHNKVKALMLLNKAITESKRGISTDAWLVLSKQKITDIL